MAKESSQFSYSVRTQKSINKAVEDITVSIKEAGFGIIGTFDFKAILHEKGQELRGEYRLLEVCNPVAARQVLESDPEIGLLLPCTIAVYEKDKENWITLAKPTKLLSIYELTKFHDLGSEIEEKLVKAIIKSR